MRTRKDGEASSHWSSKIRYFLIASVTHVVSDTATHTYDRGFRSTKRAEEAKQGVSKETQPGNIRRLHVVVL